VVDPRRPRGRIDTSVVIDLERIDPADLPIEMAVSAVTMAELAAGPHATADAIERARRQDRLQRAEATFEPVPVDAEYRSLWSGEARSFRNDLTRDRFCVALTRVALDSYGPQTQVERVGASQNLYDRATRRQLRLLIAPTAVIG